MASENLKEIVIENALGGVQVDYGILHFQLATPILVTIVILIMIFALNRLLFQPVLRTLDARQKIIDDSKKQVNQTKSSIEKLSLQYEEQLHQANLEVAQAYQQAREEAQKHREELETQARNFAETELEKNRGTLHKEVGIAREELKEQSTQLSQLITHQLLS